MPIRTAEAEWTGDGARGACRLLPKSGGAGGVFDLGSRMEAGSGTNPEELIGAAQAGCLSMALAIQLAEAGYRPECVKTTARVHFAPKGGEWGIHRIDLVTRAAAPGLTQPRLEILAQQAKEQSPVAKALGGVFLAVDAEVI